MAFDMYPSISSGKQQDPVREVVMKYIDYFLPDASGTSAVAIDNKIEQAMDLVKSHLMIAVREEVEVLKERISELMDKITQLETENTLLKANISQETLQQLQLQAQLQIAGNTATGNNMITAAPTQQTNATNPTATTTTTTGTAAANNTNNATNSATATPATTAAASPATAAPILATPTAVVANNNVATAAAQTVTAENVAAVAGENTENTINTATNGAVTANGPMS